MKQSTTTVTRLEREVYAALEKTLPKPVVTANTTAHEAGFILGVAHVLQKLREGFVVERS